MPHEPTRILADYYAAFNRQDGQYLASDEGLPVANGQAYSLRVGAFFAFEEGRIVRISNHYNLADWIAQVRGSAKA